MPSSFPSYPSVLDPNPPTSDPPRSDPDPDAPLRAFSRAMRDDARDESLGCWVQGPPGSGKTHAVRRVLADEGWVVRELSDLDWRRPSAVHAWTRDLPGSREVRSLLRGQSARLILVVDDLDRLNPKETAGIAAWTHWIRAQERPAWQDRVPVVFVCSSGDDKGWTELRRACHTVWDRPAPTDAHLRAHFRPPSGWSWTPARDRAWTLHVSEWRSLARWQRQVDAGWDPIDASIAPGLTLAPAEACVRAWLANQDALPSSLGGPSVVDWFYENAYERARNPLAVAQARQQADRWVHRGDTRDCAGLVRWGRQAQERVRRVYNPADSFVGSDLLRPEVCAWNQPLTRSVWRTWRQQVCQEGQRTFDEGVAWAYDRCLQGHGRSPPPTWTSAHWGMMLKWLDWAHGSSWATPTSSSTKRPRHVTPPSDATPPPDARPKVDRPLKRARGPPKRPEKKEKTRPVLCPVVT
jgi:hypothetical protein